MSTEDYEDTYCPICDDDPGLMSHYHCSNCTETMSMMGHLKEVDGEWIFSCERHPEADEIMAMAEEYWDSLYEDETDL